jgi:hypothetical protein
MRLRRVGFRQTTALRERFGPPRARGLLETRRRSAQAREPTVGRSLWLSRLTGRVVRWPNNRLEFILINFLDSATLARISHIPSSRDAARTRRREARPEFPAGLYENILSKGNPGRNEAEAGRSKSQQKGYEKCGLGWGARAARPQGRAPGSRSPEAVPPTPQIPPSPDEDGMSPPVQPSGVSFQVQPPGKL